jgi:hypothetical protein
MLISACLLNLLLLDYSYLLHYNFLKGVPAPSLYERRLTIMKDIPMNDFEKLVRELSIRATLQYVSTNSNPANYAKEIADTYITISQNINLELVDKKDLLP